MVNEINQPKYWNIEIALAKLYVYLLPIRMFTQLSFLRTLLRGAAGYFDITIHFIAILLIILRGQGVINFRNDSSARVLKYFTGLVIYLNLSSFIMAIVIQSIYGNHGSESAFSGIVGMVIYFFQFAFMFFYNKEVFSMLSKEEIFRILKRVSIFLLVLGYWQIGVLTVGGIFGRIYNTIDVLDILADLPQMPKLPLTGGEGASAGGLISCLVMPVLYAGIICDKNKMGYILQILLWLPVIYFTNSSTAYITFSVVTVAFCILYLKYCNKNILIFVLIAICIIAMLFIFFSDSITSILPKEARDQIEYLLLEKINDRENGSTVARTVPILTNWGAFTEYPIFGVGNGLQGYFYEKSLPSWGRTQDQNAFVEISRNSVTNGAIFFPSLLSGYGIVGSIFILVFIYKLINLARNGKGQMGIFYFAFILAGVAIIFYGMQAGLAGCYYVFFMLSLPFMVRDGANENLQETE